MLNILFLTNSSYSDLYSVPAKGEANSHGGAIELPESARPNDATISLFEERKKLFIERRRREGRLYTVPPKGNAKKFTYEKNISSSKIDKQLSEGYLLSYLFYDNGVIKYDGKAKKGRFRDDITDETLFYTHSTGKSITSYIVGHAICDGYISSIDEIIDWPLMENTLYHGQPLRNLLNMAAGDKHVVDKRSTRFMGSSEHHRDMGLDTIALLLQGTKAKGNKSFYNNALADIIANYIVFKSGNDYDKLMKKVFQDKIKIGNEIAYEKHGQTRNMSQIIHKYNGSPQTLASYSYYMTRLDFSSYFFLLVLSPHCSIGIFSGLITNRSGFSAHSRAYATPILGVRCTFLRGIITPFDSIQRRLFLSTTFPFRRLLIRSAFVSLPGPSCSPAPRINTAAGTPSLPVTTFSIQCMP